MEVLVEYLAPATPGACFQPEDGSSDPYPYPAQRVQIVGTSWALFQRKPTGRTFLVR